MKKITVMEIQNAVKGVLLCGNADTMIEGIAIDSREVSSNDIFFAIVGEEQDGHIYAGSAAEKGCPAIVLHNKQIADEVKKIRPDTAILLVEDTTRALQDLAEWYLSLFPIKKIGVTGSTGKTTTKEMLYAVISQKYKTLRNLGNYNNHIGLPLTIFHLEEDIEVGIFEMGMSEFGEIHRLADIVRPDLAVITNVGTSHIEYLKTRENILKAKMEITDFFQDKNKLFVNEDNDMLTKKMVSKCMQEKKKDDASYCEDFQIVTAGEDEHADFQLSHRRDLGESGIQFTITHEKTSQEFSLPLLGNHNGWNAMLAVAVGASLDISLKEAAAGLANMEGTNRRLNIEVKNGIKLIDDTYNASPDSMKAAIDVLMSISGARKVAILADILEMGEVAEEYHYQIGEYVSHKEVDVVITIGKNAKFISEGAEAASKKTIVIHHEEKETLMDNLEDFLKPGDVVLVKGSNGMRMAEIVNKIRSL
ncbi:UDP-N-acetylmuramoyl-tripeptide--D-alanyl-D-alanine ligase [Sinanaerobacter sp. ZZT-01]|uniref:UDP-N-acetylmuramoyl-tripeptide--D-alanyl-D- alanine ligase n=1 Tax=Sinanaerobacter sp. ZZT-01 TaxID=3111540 RepID=UPI002D76C797|nr:UDP-N-acetylmuramoyl-tripeptide--D-alanyl-D-alanine ligase [Sinanaerobacter sp. ZZT-01]WRR93710.1 UDP-N-acetylmuramoyl-tripeptide--D-alanyl-D-alanine ligase [Sinanaerobacter sp. ZZT-01]